MKKAIFALGLGVMVLGSCKEESNLVQFANTAAAKDTTYIVSPVPTADPHQVVVEDFTGPSCSNCPTGHNLLLSYVTANPGRINVIGLYVTDYPQANPVNTPPAVSKYDFRDSVATVIENVIFSGLGGMPCAGIDRMPYGSSSQGGPLQVYTNNWATAIPAQLTVQDSINLSVTSTYDAAAHNAAITATITYLYPSSDLQNLSIAIVEDSFLDYQEDGFNIDSAYHFNDVFRHMVTNAPYGDPILPTIASKEAGRTEQRTYICNISATTIVNPANCRVIAFVTKNDGTGAYIYQSWQCKLTP